MISDVPMGRSKGLTRVKGLIMYQFTTCISFRVKGFRLGFLKLTIIIPMLIKILRANELILSFGNKI